MSETAKTTKTADLSSVEKRALLARLLREKSAGTRSSDSFVHRLFEAQAARTPQAIAVSDESQDLSYATLDARANRLARRISALDAGPETLVGVCLDRSADLLVALLGVLKAGSAYLPLDPEYPADRLAFMVDDARVPVLLTEERLRDAIPTTDATVLCIDSEGDDSHPLDLDQPLPRTLHTENLAYVIYTSGSTGTPKGVQISHAALGNFLLAMKRLLAIEARDTLLAVTTLSFDIAALELFLPLTVGARVVIASRALAADGHQLQHRIQSAGATFLQATPASWRLLLEAGWNGNPGLRILCGGEALPRTLADRLLDKGDALWNLYGPTETTVWSAAARVDPGDGPVSIGRPIANTRLYVLDAHLRPVPLGVIGELYIGGLGLARGYLNRPALTAERFLPDPVGDEPGARIYRTGDLARWRADGRLECLGRVDHQVKVRGFRIELGEVEAALLRVSGVREAVASAREDASGENRLVAYVVPHVEAAGNAPSLAIADLRRSLQEALPEPMVPSVFVLLDALPLTPNGKIDRGALPPPEPLVGSSTVGHVPPRGPVEEALAGIWGEVLGRSGIGVFESFFDLGGHSLLAARLLARLRDTFGVELPLRALFDVPTVAGQARRVEEALREGASAQAPPLVPTPRDGDPPASFAQQRLWFLDQLEPGSALYAIPMALRLSGTLDVPALERAFAEVVRRHESLRTTFRAEDGRPLQVIAPGLDLPLPLEDLSALPEAARQAEASRRAEEEARRPFDLARGPLIRTTLLRFSETEHVVLLNLHHIIADGWSLGVLIHEAGTLYDAFSRGLPSPLPSLPVQYADFATWQRRWLQGEVLDEQVAYWKRQLQGVPNLELATDRPRPTTLTHRGLERVRFFSASLVADLRALAKQENATLFMVLLAAFETLLHRYSGQQDFAIGAPIAGRTHSETEGLIGFFVNTLVLRADLSGDPGFRELLRRAKRTSLGAFAHQDLPFEQLVEALQIPRDPSRAPLFQVMLVLQNAPLPTLASPELAMEPIDSVSGTAKFELTLFVTESAEGLKTTLEYNADLFDPQTIDRMLGHLETLLGAIVAEPDRPVAALPMLSEAERKQLLGQGDDLDNPDDLAPSAEDLDGLSDDELDALLTRFPLEDSTDE